GGVRDVTLREPTEVDVDIDGSDTNEQCAIAEQNVGNVRPLLLHIDHFLEVAAGRLEPGEVLNGQQQRRLAAVGRLRAERVVEVWQPSDRVQPEGEHDHDHDQAEEPGQAAGR